MLLCKLDYIDDIVRFYDNKISIFMVKYITNKSKLYFVIFELKEVGRFVAANVGANVGANMELIWEPT